MQVVCVCVSPFSGSMGRGALRFLYDPRFCAVARTSCLCGAEGSAVCSLAHLQAALASPLHTGAQRAAHHTL